jgi:AraC-like DNA-binding protein
MGALVRRAAGWEYQEHLQSDKKRILDVLLDEIRRAPHEPLHLSMPADAHLLRMSMMIIEQPDSAQTLEELAAKAGVSARTARRLFLSATGRTFVHWRQQAQLSHALELLARGHAVAEVADALGYATPSSFISMFRRALGDSPPSYFAKRARSQ